MKILKFNNKIVKCWTNDIEETALQQIENVANLPFLFKHVAIMPDVHAGYGCTIGSVIATKNVIVPNLIGVDVGCGMCALKTNIRAYDSTDLINIRKEILKKVPVGFNHHQKNQDEKWMPNIPANLLESNHIIIQEYSSALKQIGTLGGGNHFIEIQKGDDGFIWIMIHSGSRNLGYKVAKYYNDKAIELNQKWFSSVPKEHQLAFLPLDHELGQDYMKEMNYCVEFAFANRKLMMERIKESFQTILPHTKFEGNLINIAHNYARLENHFGHNVVVHRKGATSARKNEIGIIPGSQGTKSYIVKGLGNKESFNSCSHGAGRVMGRNQAKKNLNFKDEKLKMKNIIHGMESEKDLDEAPGAYKDIDVVMENQKDLVKIIVELTPQAVVKG